LRVRQEIKASDLLVLFWCCHSKRSKEVATECELALHYGTAIAPVLLDSTRRPGWLAEFQWLDFRKLAAAVHRKGQPDIKPPEFIGRGKDAAAYREWISMAVVEMASTLHERIELDT
jgi:TIR domain